MSATTETTASSDAEARDSWVPMIVIAMGQMLMSFNVAAIPVSMSGMVASFNTPPTTVGTAIVLYSLGVSGFIMLGAKSGQRFGSKVFFQTAVVLFLAAMINDGRPDTQLKDWLPGVVLPGTAGDLPMSLVARLQTRQNPQ